MQDDSHFSIPESLAGQTLAAALRQLLGGLSWADVRQLIASRHVRVNGTLCLDDARRVKTGESVDVLGRAQPPAPAERDVRIVFVDADLVVVEKPPGLQTVRRAEERDWSDDRKQTQPVLEELVERIVMPGRPVAGKGRIAGKPPRRVRAVHRLDRDTSGLMLFALSARAEQELIRRFADHDVERVYWAVVHGNLFEPRTIDTWLVRDRGDQRRGTVIGETPPPEAQHAITHVRPLEQIGDAWSIVECRLETGRTHQIRIHLAEIGHMLCGEKVYLRPRFDSPAVDDDSRAPRQALHSARLQFDHPLTGRPMRFESSWPRDLAQWIEQLRLGR